MLLLPLVLLVAFVFESLLNRCEEGFRLTSGKFILLEQVKSSRVISFHALVNEQLQI